MLPPQHMGLRFIDYAAQAIEKVHLITATCDTRYVQLLWVIHRPHCKPFSQELCLQQKIVPMKIVHKCPPKP